MSVSVIWTFRSLASSESKGDAIVADHYVYLYRDEKGRTPRYVGYGKKPQRATSHLVGSHSKALQAFLQRRKYTLEIAGPFGSEELGRAVETAMISSLQPDLNVNRGSNKYRFRPLGVPELFAARLGEPTLSRVDLLKVAKNGGPSPLLFVLINNQDFDDGRKGYDPVNPPSDEEILGRMDKYWYLKRFVPGWIERPETCPRILIGVSGPIERRFILGSAWIDQSKFELTSPYGTQYEVPTNGPANLDARGLRGRRISPEANIKFGSVTSQIFLILKPDGTTIGGR